MQFVIKGDMGGAVLAGELFKAARNLSGFTVIPDWNLTGDGLDAGQFKLTPDDTRGIDGLCGNTYAAQDSPFGELQIDVKAFSWPEDSEAARIEALRAIFQPLVNHYNATRPSKVEIIQKS